ncbi:MAG: hypothetical protein HY810_00955 [Candidatus Omnitrophica bacterium]|nr:hypothetical protein [Candidatus Omnitrophota bacterium]
MENLRYIYKNLERIIAQNLDQNPELIKKKRAELEKLFSEIQNYLNFIKTGNTSKAVSTALQDAETKSEQLKQEVDSLEFQKKNTFQSPPEEWIKHRLENLHSTLSKDTSSAALALKNILGTIKMEPIADKNKDMYAIITDGEYTFKPYYVAHTKINTLALLDDRNKGANWYQWRRR